MIQTRKNDLEEKLQEIEQCAVRQLPASVELHRAFKLPQQIDSRSGNNEEYLRRMCAQKTGRVIVRGADKRTLYDLSQRGEVLARFSKPVSDGPFIVDEGIFVQELDENDRYKKDTTCLYDAITGKQTHTLPWSSQYPCKTRASYLFWNRENGKVWDLLGCSELSGDSSTPQHRPPYCDITCFSSEQIERLIENHAHSVFDATTGHLVFGRPNYMFSLNDYRESNIQFLIRGKVLQLFKGDTLWVGNYFDRKKKEYSDVPSLHTLKEKECGWKAHYFNQDIYGWFSQEDRSFSPREQCWRRLSDGKMFFKQEVPHGEELVQVGNDIWVIDTDKHTIHSFTTGRSFLLPYAEGAHALYDIPEKNPLILAADRQTFYEVPLEKVVSVERVKAVLQGNSAGKWAISLEE